MGLRDEIARDLQEIEADLENPVCSYLAQEYACVPSGNARGSMLSLGGFDVEIDFRIRIRLDALGDVVPSAGKKITYPSEEGTVYKIVNVWKDATGAFYNLDLQDPNR